MGLVTSLEHLLRRREVLEPSDLGCAVLAWSMALPMEQIASRLIDVSLYPDADICDPGNENCELRGQFGAGGSMDIDYSNPAQSLNPYTPPSGTHAYGTPGSFAPPAISTAFGQTPARSTRASARPFEEYSRIDEQSPYHQDLQKYKKGSALQRHPPAPMSMEPQLSYHEKGSALQKRGTLGGTSVRPAMDPSQGSNYAAPGFTPMNAPQGLSYGAQSGDTMEW